MVEILVDFHSGFTMKLNVEGPITTYQIEGFIKDHSGRSGEIILLYQPNPYGSRHYRYGQRPELTIGGGESCANVTINGVPKTLNGGSKVQGVSEVMKGNESLGKRKRTFEPPSPHEMKRARHEPFTAVQRPTIIGDAIETASLPVSLSAPIATGLLAHQSNASGGLHGAIADEVDSLEQGLSVQGKEDSMSTKRDTKRAIASTSARKGLHLTVGWTGME